LRFDWGDPSLGQAKMDCQFPILELEEVVFNGEEPVLWETLGKESKDTILGKPRSCQNKKFGQANLQKHNMYQLLPM